MNSRSLALSLVLAVGSFTSGCLQPPAQKCAPSNCAGGCCDLQGACQAPSASTCGQGGNLCTACIGNQTCQLGICVQNQQGGGGGATGGGGGATGGGTGGGLTGGGATGGGGTGGGATGGGTGGGVTGGGTGGGVTGGGTGGGVTGGGTGGGVTGGGTGGGVTGGGTGGGVTGGGTGGGAGMCSLTCAGCCQGNTCITAVSTAACGSLGDTCSTCDTARADNCDTGGCRCGTNAPCAGSTRCVNSQCVCDASACPTGCCQGMNCNASPTVAACGTAGQACMTCDTIVANNCGNGSCRCGLNAACGPGTRCFNSQCVCDSTSCTNGCCNGTTCVTPVTLAQCGAAGAACITCDAQRSDNCGPAGCRCGSSASCAMGVMCVSGSCGGVRQWVQRATTGAPSNRSGHVMTFDPVRNRVVLFGGRMGSTDLGDTWEYDTVTTTWTPRMVMGPSARQFAAMAWDPVRNVGVLFGGQSSGMFLQDTWLWTGTAWVVATPMTPPPVRYFHSMVWDPDRQRIVIFGGETSSSTLSDTWEWDGTNWAQRTTTNAPQRAVHMAAYDTVRHVLVFYGGFVSGSQVGTWELGASGAWVSPMVSGSPTARHGAVMGYDPVQQRVILLGGTSNSGTLSDFFTYDGAAWTPITPDTGLRAWGSMAYDSTAGRFVIFGGYNGTDIGGTWEY